ncbi:hypothetical protein H4217_008031 [Coemansia sp. RSA 1939]|nr:hypothetical protein H4217_008031 [Coemansia sp. RSA 1939]
MQQYTSPTARNNFSAHSQAAQQHIDDQNIAALNSFLGISQTTMPLSSPQQPTDSATCSNEQAIAAFLASTTSAYPGGQALSLSTQESPMLVNSIGITPVQSIQSIQFSDFGADAAAIAAAVENLGAYTQPTSVSNSIGSPSVSSSGATVVEMGTIPLLGQSFSSNGLEPSAFNMFSNASAQHSPENPINQTVLQPVSTTQSFMSPTEALGWQQQQQQQRMGVFDTNNASVLGKRARADEIHGNSVYRGLFGTMGAPLSKRVSMPASYGATTNDVFFGASTNAFANSGAIGTTDGYPAMPAPTGTAMQRIASYNPGAVPADTTMQPSLIGNDVSGTADESDFSFTPAKVPIGRLKTTAAVITSASANTDNSVFDSIEKDSPRATSPPVVHHQRKVAHNAIERRYRNNINDRIRDLRNSVPALQNIRPKNKQHQQHPGADTINNDENDDDIDDENDAEEAAVVDGVEAATKLNKATILGKSTEYIYHLRRSNDLYKRESLYLQDIMRKMPNGDKIVARILQKARQDSAIATTALCLPESSVTRPKKKRA